MAPVPWHQQINFTSALLLHSCITIWFKELSNSLVLLYRLISRAKDKTRVAASVVFDGYTSVCSKDRDGELAELYFTNTGFVLLLASLSSSIALNLLLPTLALNLLVATTFGMAFIASAMVACREKSVLMPVMALRRAGRFIWSDTPFVNFFTLIYIAVVLKGASKLELKDYVLFRSVAILELVFMKARLAAADVETQRTMIERLVKSEYVIINDPFPPILLSPPPPLQRQHIISFTTAQRLSVMLYKTTIGYAPGSLCGPFGPTTLTVPRTPGHFVDEAEQYGWRIYRVSPELLVLEDCVQDMVATQMKKASTLERRGIRSRYTKFIAWSHGVLLRRVGRRRVVWLMRMEEKGRIEHVWRGNANLVTGLTEVWLRDNFQRALEGDRHIVREIAL
ncbi:hypothetical protein P153DRAFT_429562 [Dothidotthia symphoricarpi CBS 119687]|uniref:Uncharacterized protein n=1 Tax=Dothidotthia symphoricarpi CBS 119687 TaxID=1392245 RepID=A0A6A6AMW8_9PLEO|nr:uncharacterized protein P153DRAFT_429562 [Dothidotthia symphoricarpi CBS 119687]KAF2132425.1 hypothetical protein P153DRAFT_429562 [Dothidotthia symphoricarpi CBS 119687]